MKVIFPVNVDWCGPIHHSAHQGYWLCSVKWKEMDTMPRVFVYSLLWSYIPNEHKILIIAIALYMPYNTQELNLPTWDKEYSGSIRSMPCLLMTWLLMYRQVMNRHDTNIMSEDALAPCIARSSTDMLLTMYDRWVLVKLVPWIATICVNSVVRNYAKCNCKVSNIRRTKSQNLTASRLIL